jgi:hypothetical protein
VKGTHALRVCVGMGSLVAHRQKKDTPRLVKKVSGGAERDKITFLVKLLWGDLEKILLGGRGRGFGRIRGIPTHLFEVLCFRAHVVAGASCGWGGHPPIAPAQRAARDSQSCRRELLFA